MAGKGDTVRPYDDSAPTAYEDTVSIVIPRQTAEDLYYALALAMGSGSALGDLPWIGGGKSKGGNGYGGKGPPGPKGAPKA